MSQLSYYLSGARQNLSIGFAVLVIWIILGNDVTPEEEEIISLDEGFLLFVLFSLMFGSLVFYLIFTKLSSIAIRYIYSVVLFSPFVLTIFEIYQTSFVSYNRPPTLSVHLGFMLISALIVIGLGFAYIYARGIPMVHLRNLGIIISSVAIARIMSIFFDLPSIVVFAIIISLFDIYSVFRGPISKVMGKPERVDIDHYIPEKQVMDRHFAKICKDGTPVLLSYQNTILGIGDVLFFAILMYYSMLIWNIAGFVLTLLLIMVGSTVTMYFLKRLSPLPGLPFPVFSALLGYGILYLLFGI